MLKKKFFVTLVVGAVLVFTLAGCTTTTNAGAHIFHGLFSGFGVDSMYTADGYRKIESFTNVLGLFDIGYDKYAKAVMQADTQNRKITTVERNWFSIVITYTAYTK